MRLKHTIVIVFGAVLALSAQPNPTPDERFVARTAQANLAEVQISAWAREHALSDEVRQFAGKVLDDHTVLADELRSMAGKQNAPAVPDLDPKDAVEIDRMRTLEPNQLDRAYMREIMKWHQRELDAFRREIENGKNPDLRNWASLMLAKTQAQLSEGEETERAIGMEVAEKIASNEHR